MKTILYIINPTSGKGNGKRIIPFIKSLNNSSLKIEIILTKYPKHATEIIKNLTIIPDLIVSVGGDGTLNEIINGLQLGAPYNLAVLPIGSGNDFVKNFNIPKNIKDNISFLHGQNDFKLTRIDLGEIKYLEKSDNIEKSHKFCNSTGIGFDAQVGSLKKDNNNLTGLASYFYAVIQALFNYNSIIVDINFADIKLNGEKLMISIGNGVSSGGGFYLNPNALVDDGNLDISIFNKVTRRRLLTALPYALVNKIEKIPEAQLYKFNNVIIKLKTPTYIHCDGEIISKKLTHAEISVIKNAVNFISKK